MKKTGPLFLENKFYILILFHLSLFIFLLDLASAYLLASLINKDLTKELFVLNMVHDSEPTVIIVMVMILQIMREFLTFFNQYYPAKVATIIELKNKTDSIKKVFQHELDLFNKFEKNKLIFKIHQQTIALALFISDNIKIFNNCIFILFYLGVIFFFQPIPFIIILLCLGLLFYFTNSLIIQQESLGEKIRDFSLKLHDDLSELILGLKDIIYANSQKFFYKRNEEGVNNLIFFKIKSLKLGSLFAPVIRSAAILLLGSIVFMYSYFNEINIDQEILSQSLIYLYLLFRIQSPLLDINNLRSSVLLKLAASENIIDLNNYYKKEEVSNKTLKKFKFKDKLSFVNLDFSYDEKTVLKKINLSIKKNYITGFFGKPGSGKTTLVNLILRTYKIEKKRVFFDGVSIDEIDKNSIRENISIISQNGYLFNTSMINNITMFSKLNKKKFDKVVKLSGVNDFVNTLSDRFETVIGGKEIPLSGGQIQRILIARALYKDSQILILDEATSAQDSISEFNILDKIRKYKKKLTIIIIAHRFTALKHSDYIYCLDNGKVVEEGTWKMLSKKINGHFYKMLTIQKMDNNNSS